MSARYPWEGQEVCLGVVTPGLLLGSGQKASVTSPAPCVLHTFHACPHPACLYTQNLTESSDEGTGLCWPGSSCFCTSRLKTCLLGAGQTASQLWL